MKPIFLLFFTGACISPMAVGENLQQLDRAFHMASGRVGGYLGRYVKYIGTPCLTVQTMDAEKNWEIVDTKVICSIDGLSLHDDFMDASFENISFTPEGVKSTLSLTEHRSPGEILRNCIIPISGGQVGELTCGPSMRVHLK